MFFYLFLKMRSKYILNNIRHKMSTPIYLYLYLQKYVDTNIFLDVFGSEIHIGHTLSNTMICTTVDLIESLHFPANQIGLLKVKYID